MIKGLTLLRPWPSAFLDLDPAVCKRIENRSWKPDANTQYLALHAGKGWDKDGAVFIQQLADHFQDQLRTKPYAVMGQEHPESVIFAVARIKRCVDPGSITDPIQARWSFGPHCWELDQFKALDPIPCKGAQGLWNLEPGILQRVRAAWQGIKPVNPCAFPQCQRPRGTNIFLCDHHWANMPALTQKKLLEAYSQSGIKSNLYRHVLQEAFIQIANKLKSEIGS